MTAIDTRKEAMDQLFINVMLDKYNDYMTLHKLWGDEEYKDKADGIMFLLRHRMKRKIHVTQM